MVCLSLVIPTYNNEANIGKLLESIDNASKGIFEIKEIIIVDGGSTDGTLKIVNEQLSRMGYNYKVYTNVKKRGLAREWGWQHSTHDFICMFDADLFLDKNWFHVMSKAFVEYPVFDVWYGRVEMPKDIIGLIPRLAGTVYDYYFERIRRKESVRRTGCDTSNTIFSRKILEKVGGFDIRLPFSEDADIGWRIYQSGGKIVLLHNAIVYHYHRQTLKARVKQKFQFGYGRAFLHRKYKVFNRLDFWLMYFLLPYSTLKLVYKLGRRHGGLGVLSALWYPVDQLVMLSGFIYAQLDKFKKIGDK